MSVIAALLPNPDRLKRLRAAVRDAHTVIAYHTWDELLEAAQRQVHNLAVVDLDAAEAPNFDPVRQLRRHLPNITLLAYVSLTPDRVQPIFDAGRYGFEALVVADIDDGPTAFGRAIEKAAARGVATLIRRFVPAAANQVASDALLIAVTRAGERLTPTHLAQILGVGPRQLTRQLVEARYPSANQLLTWARLMVAAEMMDDTRHSGARIAMTLDFPSASAFRNTCQRYLGATPSEVRAAGGVNFVLEAFARTLASYEERSTL
jgi:AraC-like DNA-binding protein